LARTENTRIAIERRVSSVTFIQADDSYSKNLWTIQVTHKKSTRTRRNAVASSRRPR
jgi:hypothetical protein